MQKRLKITLYIILILVIIAVIWLMFWKTSTNTETSNNTNIEEISTWEENENSDDNWDTVDLEIQNDTFENDVIKDLEWLFSDNNWYEDVEWEFWFTNLETE